MTKNIGYSDEASVNVLAEDTMDFDTSFRGRFGLSLLLELKAGGSEEHILFNTNSEAQPILHNLQILEKSLQDVKQSSFHIATMIILMGSEEFWMLSTAQYRSLRTQRFSGHVSKLNPEGIRHIGIPPEGRANLEGKGAVLTLTNDPIKLMTGVVTTGEIERKTAFEELEDHYPIVDGEMVQDHEWDDSAIVMNFRESLVIITGCCHAGIANTMMYANEIAGCGKIHAVVGGLHFIEASEEKITKSVEAMHEVVWVFAGHCTVFEGLHRISETMGERSRQIHTGSMIHFPIEDPSQRIETLPTAVRDLHRY